MKITIIGAGATGSELMLSLPKMGFMNITIIDYDEVSASNYSNQLFGTKSIGRKKVEVIKELVEFLGLEGTFEFIDAKVDEDYEIVNPMDSDRIVVMAVDNMEARQAISDQMFLANKGLLVDTRLGKAFATGIFIKMDNIAHIEKYKKVYMFSDEEAVQDLCTEKTYKGVSDWVRQYIVNSCWAYCVTDMKDCPQVVNINCDTQRVDVVKF